VTGLLERLIADLVSGPSTVPQLRAVRKRWSRELGSTSRAAVLKLALGLIERSPHWRFVAYELVQHHEALSQLITQQEVERLGRGIASWGDVDCFGCFIAGPAWKLGRIGDAYVKQWAQSQDLWQRRAALVSTVPLNPRGGAGDASRTLGICMLLLDDREDMVVKALSWALRTLAKRDPESVRAFIEKHEQRVAARARRETWNLLRTGRKSGRARETL
jgi:3-methyladenine DNA glycosylase AlkD